MEFLCGWEILAWNDRGFSRLGGKTTRSRQEVRERRKGWWIDGGGYLRDWDGTETSFVCCVVSCCC